MEIRGQVRRYYLMGTGFATFTKYTHLHALIDLGY